LGKQYRVFVAIIETNRKQGLFLFYDSHKTDAVLEILLSFEAKEQANQNIDDESLAYFAN